MTRILVNEGDWEVITLPVLKHEQHTQSDHGNWARGVSAEEDELINDMEGVGPSLLDIEAALTPAEQPDYTDLKDYVANDADMYEAAIEGIEERMKERYQNLTEDEYNKIEERELDTMVEEYIDSDYHAIAELWMKSEGTEEFNFSDLTPFFDEVFGVTHEVKNAQGEVVTTLTSKTNHMYLDGERLVVMGSVQDDARMYTGEFQRSFFKSQDKDGNEIWAVEHDLFKMEDEYAGVGFGSKFIAQQEAWYTARGFGRIDVSTAWDGARHWAKAGYDFDDRNTNRNVRELIKGRGYNSDDFAEGSANRAEFDALVSRMVDGYNPATSSFNGVAKPITSDNFPIPHDFLMIGYADRVQINTNQITGKPVYSWAGARLLDGLHMKYSKGLSKEGRTITQGPIDRDGDGLVYDGTPREKPAPTVN